MKSLSLKKKKESFLLEKPSHKNALTVFPCSQVVVSPPKTLQGATAEAKKSSRLPYNLKWWPLATPLKVSRMSASQKPETLSVLLCCCGCCSEDEGDEHQR